VSGRELGRRTVAAGGVALLMSAAAVTPSAIAEALGASNPDAHLFRCVAAVRRCDAALRVSDAATGLARTDDELEEEIAAWHRALDAVIATEATTREGVRQKAAALLIALEREVPSFLVDTIESVGRPHDNLALSLARDVLRGAVA
jgi:hypothetical protein